MDFHTRLTNPRERIYLPELLKEVSKEKAHAQKIAMLRAYSAKNAEHEKLLNSFIECVYHPAVVFELPPGAPEFKSAYADYNLAPSTLTKAFGRVPYFVKGHSRFIERTIKRESVFIQELESLYKDDAALFIMAKDKKIDARKYKGINEPLFREAFPGLLPPQAESKVKS